MIEGAVDDAVGLLRPAAQLFRLFQGAAPGFGARRLQLRRARIGARHAQHLMACLQQLGHDP